MPEDKNMNDSFTRQQFLILGAIDSDVTSNERQRIINTVSIIPKEWQSIVDVGCGDGRVSAPLLERGHKVIGMDWSTTSLRKFGPTCFVCDIRTDWPLTEVFDGAICAEVLEHLPFEQAHNVVQNIRLHCRKGYVITVPAYEQLETHYVNCAGCHRNYHIWGHLHSFQKFEDVDLFVGDKSVERLFVPYRGGSPSAQIDQLKRHFGYQPYSENAVCPFCGARLLSQAIPHLFSQFAVWSLSKFDRLTNFIRPQTGWFVCRYRI